MAKYSVPIQVTLTLDVVVETSSPVGAIQIATYLVNASTPGTVAALGALDLHSARSNSALPVPDDARLSTYTCERCQALAFKRDFGPGGQVCPVCRQPPVSAQEFHELHAQRIGDTT